MEVRVPEESMLEVHPFEVRPSQVEAGGVNVVQVDPSLVRVSKA